MAKANCSATREPDTLFVEDIEDDDDKKETELVDHEHLPCYLEELPNEVLLHILSFLTTFEVCHKVGLLNRHFLRISRDPCLIKEIRLKPPIQGCNTDSVLNIISR